MTLARRCFQTCRAAASSILRDQRRAVEIPIVVSMLMVALISRVAGLESRSIWMDEDAQARRILAGGFDSGLIERAATQQQPPLDYYLEYIGLHVFGTTPFGARIHAALMGALAVVMTYMLVRRLFEGRGPALIAALLALLHPQLIFYSHEGRPIASGVFFATLCLYTLFGFMTSRARWYGQLAWVLALALNGTGFLLALGFQPVIFIATAAVSLTPSLLGRRLRWRVPLAWLAFGASGWVALPTIQRLLSKGSRYVGTSGPLERVASIADQVWQLDLQTWSIPWAELLGHLWPFAVVVTALGLAGLVKALVRGTDASVAQLTLFLVIFALVFPALFEVTFSALVDYQAKTRYYLTQTTALIALLAALSNFAWTLVAAWVTSAHQRQRLLGVALTLLVGATLVLQTRATRAAYRQQRRDWASMYELFRRQTTPGVAYMVHLVEPGRKRAGYYAQRFYYTRNGPRPIALRKQEQLERDCKSRRRLNRRNIFIVVRYGWSQIKRIRKQLERDVPGLRVHVFYGTSVIQLRLPKNDPHAVTRVFQALTKHLEPTAESYNAHKGLATLRLCQRDFDGARAAVRSMRALSPQALGTASRTLLRQIDRAERPQKRRKRAR